MKWYKKPATFLLLLLISTSLVMTVAGLTLKHTVARSSDQIRDTLAIAVPFLLLRGDVVLDFDSEAHGQTQPEQEPVPEVEEVPDMKTETETETEVIAQVPIESESEDQAADELAFAPVEEEYFDTALFIGDSRTVGLALYGRLGKADYFADVGMSFFNLLEKTVSDNGFEDQDLKTLLQSKQYQTIYIMLGINELGYPLESIQKQLESVLDEVSTLQPDAMIILMGNLGVTQKKEARSAQISMERIQTVNQMIASHADDIRVFYLDVNPFFADENGYLRSDVTSDGTHPYAVEYKNWSQWLKGFGIQEMTK